MTGAGSPAGGGPPRPVAGVVVAAGSGERFGAGEAKAFVELAGEPLLVHAVRALARSGVVGSIVVVAPPGEEDRAREALGAAALTVRHVCGGGATRQASVACGLAHLAPGDAVVAVHDAARPLATPDLVARTVAALRRPAVAVAPGLPVADTLKRAGEGGRVLETLARHDLWAVQTPQVFDRSALEQAHTGAGAGAGPGPGATDDLALVEACGGTAVLVPGERRNFKITYPGDLALAEALLAAARP